MLLLENTNHINHLSTSFFLVHVMAQSKIFIYVRSYLLYYYLLFIISQGRTLHFRSEGDRLLRGNCTKQPKHLVTRGKA